VAVPQKAQAFALALGRLADMRTCRVEPRPSRWTAKPRPPIAQGISREGVEHLRSRRARRRRRRHRRRGPHQGDPLRRFRGASHPLPANRLQVRPLPLIRLRERQRLRVRRLAPRLTRLPINGGPPVPAASALVAHRVPVAQNPRPTLVAVLQRLFASPICGCTIRGPAGRADLVRPVKILSVAINGSPDSCATSHS